MENPCKDIRIRGTGLQITAHHFCAAIYLDDQALVVQTAPILHYMKDWNRKQVEDYCHYKNWNCEVIR